MTTQTKPKFQTLIEEFLNKFGTKTSDAEETSQIELMIDDHTYIEYKNQDYYLPQSNSNFDEDDLLLLEFLNDKYGN